MEDQTFLIGRYLITAWEGQHPHRHDTCWKWRIEDTESDGYGLMASGHCDDPWTALTTALRSMTFETLNTMSPETRETYRALWPGLGVYQPGAPQPPDDFDD